VRHRKSNKKLNRDTKGRKALFRNLLTEFFLAEAIVTTKAKAKVIRPQIDKLINKAKKPSLVNKRFIYAHLTKPEASAKLINDITSRTKIRESGYSRIVSLGTRLGDRASMAKIELIATPKEESVVEEGKKTIGSKKITQPTKPASAVKKSETKTRRNSKSVSKAKIVTKKNDKK
jgi:large subunit ribosomal protein L17